MPGFLLHVGATVLCSHAGQATPTLVGTTRVLSNGQPLLVQSSQAICAPTGTPLLIVATQTRVFAT